MSPIFTDAGDSRRFMRVFAAMVVVLLALCVTFLTIGYLQGPKLASAQVDTTAVVELRSQQLRIFANQPIATVQPNQVSITPPAEFSVSTSGDIVAVQFDERLDYATEYTVRIEDVTSLYSPQRSAIEYRFQTPTAELLYLARGEPFDEIVRTTSAGGSREVVYSAPRIQAFVSLGPAAVVASLDGRSSTLDLVSLVDAGAAQRIQLPRAGIVHQLQASSSGTVAGFTLDDEVGQPGSPLYWVDLESSGRAVPVTGIDGNTLRVSQWRFLPGSVSIVALSGDGTLLLIDTEANTVVPLGQYQSFSGMTPDGATAIVNDTFGAVLLTIADGTERRIDLGSVDGENAYLGTIIALPRGELLAKAVLAADFAPVVVRSIDGATSVLYRTLQDAGSIQDLVVSPNGQYVAIETVPDTSASVSDGYEADARSTSSTTVVVDVRSGAVVSSFTGFAPAW